MKQIKSPVIFLLILTLLFPLAVFAKTDSYIYNDAVANTYAGRPEAVPLIDNLGFTDLPSDLSAQDAIVRSGVLNMIKAYEEQYRPNAIVSKEEAIAFALRAVGMEDDAQAAGVSVIGTLPADSPLRTVWAIGYLNLAWNMGLITAADYANTLTPDPSSLDPETAFIRTDPATREELADWLALALQYAKPEVFATTATQQFIYNYSDWDTITPQRVNSVENLLRSSIMSGIDGRFQPKGTVTRLDTALILRNMDKIHYDIVGLVKKTGTVGGLADDQFAETAAGTTMRSVYVRSSDGTLELLEYSSRASSSPQDGVYDAVVLKEGQVTGLASLTEGDQIEYLVEPSTGTVWYVQVTSGLTLLNVQGRLRSFDLNAGTITFTDGLEENAKTYTFPMANALYGIDADGSGYFMFSNRKRSVDSMPIGRIFDVTVTNDVVTRLLFVGDPELLPETRGIVIENDPDMGYITILDDNGAEVTRNYNNGTLRVQKTEDYDMRDTIGSIHSLFPDFVYNPRETDMYSIEPGDIVSFRTDPEDGGIIISLSASTNYTTRYGKIREFRTDGDVSQMLMQFENGGTAWFTVVDGIMILKNGTPSASSVVQVGDWARLLVNQAVIGPGYMLESVKEMALESDGHYISTIVKGKLAGINLIQNQLNIENALLLTANGWDQYKQLNSFNIKDRNIQYYYDGRSVTLSYVSNYLKRAEANVYIAMENNYAGEAVTMVSFRTGRDELLKADTVLASDGAGGFTILSNEGSISTDAGTIVRRNGRMVDGLQILAPDYAVVSLSDYNTAAVVDIVPTPETSGLMIEQGRILSVDQGKSFKVQSIALFTGQEWNYTPIQREFTIDHNTLFINANGLTSIDSFIDYTPDTVVDKIYYIVVDGSRAARVIEPPDRVSNATQAVRGTIYAIEGNTVSLKDLHYYNPRTGGWPIVSTRDASGTVTLQNTTIIVDRNEVVGANQLQVGQQIKVMTNVLPDERTSGMNVNAYIVLVER